MAAPPSSSAPPAKKAAAGSWSRSVNGLPVWAWAAIGGVSLAGVYVFVRGYRKSAASSSTAAAGTATQGNAPLVIPLPGPPGVAGPKGDVGAPAATPPPAGTPAPPPVDSDPRPPSPLPAPGTGAQPFYYLVKKGDTWESIARFYRGNADQWPDIANWNRMFNPATGKATGQPTPFTQIVIPGARAVQGVA